MGSETYLQAKRTATLERNTKGASVRDVVRSPGKQLDSGTRDFMESRFGHDFSRVRVHTDTRAAESARSIGARAYTFGSDIAFAENEFAPSTYRGRELLGHELAHTIQQRNASGLPPSSDRGAVFEASAAAAGRSVAYGHPVSDCLPASGVGLSLDIDEDEERRRAIAEGQEIAARIARELEADEAEEKAEREEAEKPASFRPTTLSLIKPEKTKSRLLPGQFTDEEVKKVTDEAEEKTKLGELALTLAEKQARRREFWDSNPSYNSKNTKRAFELDLYWDPGERSYIRQPYVSKNEDVIHADPEAKRLYNARLWDLTHNKPEKKGLIRRVLDRPVHWVCKHTNPCSGLIEQMHEDKAAGMSHEDALKRALTRFTLEGALMMAPGRGPSGPISPQPAPMPVGPFGVPAFATGAPVPVGKPPVPAKATIPKDAPKFSTSTPPKPLQATKLEPTAADLTKPVATPEATKLEPPKGADPAKQPQAKVEAKNPKAASKKSEPTKPQEEVAASPKGKIGREDPQAGVKLALDRAKQRLAEGNADIKAYNERINEARRTATTPAEKAAVEELKARRDHQVDLNFGQGGHQATVTRLSKALDAQTYARPKFWAGMRDRIWQNALKEGNGTVRSPSGQEIKPGDPWVIGHRPKYEFWKHQQSAAERGISREKFIEELNRDPSHYRPETRRDNESHMYEDKTSAYLGY